MTKTTHHWTLVALVCCALAMAAAPVAFAAGLPAPQSVELRNGLRVILAPDPRASSVDLAVWYPAGTISESTGKSGTTNMLAQLMFLGTERFTPGAHIEQIRAAGGTVNSLVNPDYATFYQTVPPAALDLAIELEADRMRALTFRDGDVEALREGVRAHYRNLRRGGSLGLALERLYAVAFAGHPYGWPVSGLAEDLDRITPRDLRAYHRARFTPERAVVTVVGRFDPEATLASLRRHFEAVPRRGSRVPSPPRLPTPRKELRSMASAGESPMVLVGWRGPGVDKADLTALELVAQILVASPTSRLLRSPIAPGVAARGELDVRRLASLFYCAASIAPRADTAGVEAALVERIESLATNGISELELAHAKKQLEAASLFAAQTSRGRAQQIGFASVMLGDPLPLDQRVQAIRAATVTTVEEAARQLLKPNQRCVVWLMPESGATGGSEP